MSGDGDADRRLFEQAVADLEQATRSKLARSKSGTQRSAGSAAGPRRSRRLDKLRKSAVPDAVVDLHGLDRNDAVARVRCFLQDHRQQELLLIVHGKGRGILQQRVTRLLSEHEAVAEHAAAPQRLGGQGARLVRLRRDKR